MISHPETKQKKIKTTKKAEESKIWTYETYNKAEELGFDPTNNLKQSKYQEEEGFSFSWLLLRWHERREKKKWIKIRETRKRDISKKKGW